MCAPGLDQSQRCTTGKWRDELSGLQAKHGRGITVWDRNLGFFPCASRGASELFKCKTKRSFWKHWQENSWGNCCKISPLTWPIVLIYFLLFYPSLKFSLKKKAIANLSCTFFFPLWPNRSSFFSHSSPCLVYWMWFPVKLIQVPSDLPAVGHGSLGRRKPRQAALQWGNSQLSNRREEAAPKYHSQLLWTNY